jgi:hypothetical protein
LRITTEADLPPGTEPPGQVLQLILRLMPPKAGFLALISRAMRNLYSRLRVKMTPGGVLPDGVPLSESIKGLMRALERIEPGSAADLEVDAAEGGLLGFDFESDAQFPCVRRWTS